MKRLLILIVLAIAIRVHAVPTNGVPLTRPYLQTQLDANLKAITNAGTIESTNFRGFAGVISNGTYYGPNLRQASITNGQRIEATNFSGFIGVVSNGVIYHVGLHAPAVTNAYFYGTDNRVIGDLGIQGTLGFNGFASTVSSDGDTITLQPETGYPLIVGAAGAFNGVRANEFTASNGVTARSLTSTNLQMFGPSTLRGTNYLPAGSSIAFQKYSMTTLANGANATVPIGTNVFVELSGNTAAVSLHGLWGGVNRDGDWRMIVYRGAYGCTIAHDSGTEPFSTNRIRIANASDRVFAGPVAMTFLYSGSEGRWLLIAADGSENITANISGSATTLGTNATIYGSTVFLPNAVLYGPGATPIVMATNFGPGFDHNAGVLRIFGGDSGIEFRSRNAGAVHGWTGSNLIGGDDGMNAPQFTASGSLWGFRGMGADLKMPFYKDGDPVAALCPLPPLIYTTWWEWHTNATAAIITNLAAYLVSSGMRDAGFNTINIDDGWQAAARTGGGYLTWNTAKFPNGIRPVSDHLHSLGMKLGIYTSFSTTTCEGLPGTPSYYVERDVNTFASWGCDGIKIDDCPGQETSELYNARAGVLFANAVLNINDAAGWGGTNRQRMELIQSTRYTAPANPYDAMPQWKALGTMNIIECATPFQFDSGNATATNAFGRTVLAYNMRQFIGPGHYVEIDGLYTGGTNNGGAPARMWTNNALRAVVTGAAIISSPLIIGAFGSSNIWAFTNREVLRIQQDAANVSYMTYTSNALGAMFTKPLSRGFGTNSSAGLSGEMAVALMNISPTNKTFTVTAAQLGMSSNTVFDVRDCWYQTNVGRFAQSGFTFTVTPTNAALLQVIPFSEKFTAATYTNATVYRADGTMFKTEGESADGYYSMWFTPASGIPTVANYGILAGNGLTRLNVASGGNINAYIANGTRVFQFDGTTAIIDQPLKLTSQATPPVVPTGNDGTLWNSNKVIYWVTTTKTNLVSDGR